MLSQRPKPHRIKWIEAERELATRGFFFPSHPTGHVYFPVENEHDLWQPKKLHDPREDRRPPPK